MNKANLKINDYGQISNAEISIGRVNVVCGVNSCGKSTVSKLLYCFLKSQIYSQSLDYLSDSEGLEEFDENISFKSDSNPSEIFYIDNISIFDLKNLEILRVDHIVHIKEALEEEGEVSSEMLLKIDDILQTELNSNSAGIREIEIVKTLLKNGRLGENSFLIIDEPESSLHPQWEIKFAEILILLVREMNITIYLNSHSAMFIEAISLYCQYYGLLGDTEFYITEEQAGGMYDFKKISPKNMGEVYENLTSAYDDLDKLKAKILFKE